MKPTAFCPTPANPTCPSSSCEMRPSLTWARRRRTAARGKIPPAHRRQRDTGNRRHVRHPSKPETVNCVWKSPLSPPAAPLQSPPRKHPPERRIILGTEAAVEKSGRCELPPADQRSAPRPARKSNQQLPPLPHRRSHFRPQHPRRHPRRQSPVAACVFYSVNRPLRCPIIMRPAYMFGARFPGILASKMSCSTKP